jgi:GxxExxY protein
MSDLNSVEYVDEALTGKVIASAYALRRGLGYGFSESTYRRAIVVELQFLDVPVAQERTYELFHRGVSVGRYRADLVAEDRIIVEVKTGKVLEANAYGQLLNYLRAANLPLGLLIHFGPSGVTVKRVICSPEFRPRDS